MDGQPPHLVFRRESTPSSDGGSPCIGRPACAWRASTSSDGHLVDARDTDRVGCSKLVCRTGGEAVRSWPLASGARHYEYAHESLDVDTPLRIERWPDASETEEKA